MPVLAKFSGIVIRLLSLGNLGTHLHAFHGNDELVVDLFELKVLQGQLPGRLGPLVLDWARRHRYAIFAGLSRHQRLAMMFD